MRSLRCAKIATLRNEPLGNRWFASCVVGRKRCLVVQLTGGSASHDVVPKKRPRHGGAFLISDLRNGSRSSLCNRRPTLRWVGRIGSHPARSRYHYQYENYITFSIGKRLRSVSRRVAARRPVDRQPDPRRDGRLPRRDGRRSQAHARSPIPRRTTRARRAREPQLMTSQAQFTKAVP